VKFDRVEPIGQVEVTYRSGAWEIWCEWPQKTRRTDISTVLRVTWLGSDPPRLILSSTRLNLLSASGKTGITAAMRRVTKDVPDDLIHSVAEDLLMWFRQAGTTTTPNPAPRVGTRHLLYPIWPSTGGTIVAGGTNSYKSWVALAAAVQVTLSAEVLRGNTRAPEPRQILYCDWETKEDTFAERLYAVLSGAGLPLEPCVAYRHLTVTLADAAESLATEVARHQYAGVVIDSLSAACGGSLNDDDTAREFWNGVAMLRVPVFVTAHKSSEALRRGWKQPFGSVMHQNLPRVIWDATREPSSNLVVWENRNDNNSDQQGMKLAWKIDILNEGEEENRCVASATFQAVNPSDVRLATNEGDTLADRLAVAIIEHGPSTAKELASLVGTSDASVRNQLSRHVSTFTRHPDGVRWDLKTG